MCKVPGARLAVLFHAKKKRNIRSDNLGPALFVRVLFLFFRFLDLFISFNRLVHKYSTIWLPGCRLAALMALRSYSIFKFVVRISAEALHWLQAGPAVAA